MKKYGSDEVINAPLTGTHIQIIACAGSGKTETLARRVAHLLAQGVEPQSIVAFTFTEKAAAELKQRILDRSKQKCGNSILGRVGRMTVARDLLHESGSIFVQIGDENVHRVRAVLDEVFGEKNYVSEIVVKKKGSQVSGNLEPVNDFILLYAKNVEAVKFRKLWLVREDEEIFDDFPFVELESGERLRVSELSERDGRPYLTNFAQFRSAYPNARLFGLNPLKSGGYRRNQSIDFKFQGRVFPIGDGQCWKHTVVAEEGNTPGMTRLAYADRLFPLRKDVRFIRYSPEPSIKQMSNWWDGLGGAPNQVYVVQTNVELVKRCILMTTDPGDLVLDPTCGSGTTAYTAEQWGRRWITIDTSRVAIALARSRLMGARYPYYLLADSVEGQRKEAEVSALRAENCADARRHPPWICI